jgi:lipopolysaccharide transport system permease protein
LYSLEAVRTSLPRWLAFIYTLNPLAGIVDTFRRALVLQQSPDYAALLTATAIAALLLPVAYVYFKHVELTVADNV